MKITVAVLDKKGGNAASKAINALEEGAPQNTTCFVTAAPPQVTVKGNLKTLRAKNLNAPVAVAAAYSENVEPEVFQTENASIVLDGRTYAVTRKPPMTEDPTLKTQKDYSEFAEAFLFKREGDYTLTIAEAEKIVASRDPLGVQPLYYGENKEVAVLASNKKALWSMDVSEERSFPPGHVATVTREGFRFKPGRTLPYSEPVSVTMAEAAEKLQKMLEASVAKRVSGLKEVAVAFSGGLDSSLVALLAKKCGANVQLVHVSLENQPETEAAWMAAEALQLPMQVHLFKESDVEKVISEVVGLIEEPDPVKASIGVPFYWTAEKAAEAGFKVLLAGQGADELFGGYQRYVTEYIAEGDEKVRRTMYNDVVNIHESNLERDVKICSFHDVQLRVPFASYPIVEFAMSFPTELKFERKADSLRKLVLRKTAADMGLSKALAEKPKKAVQYSTGISNALKKLAKKQNLTMAEYINRVFTETKSNTGKA